jgi:hypothetical protein
MAPECGTLATRRAVQPAFASAPKQETRGMAFERARFEWALLALAAPSSVGCVASIREERFYGPPRPALDARLQVVRERGPGIARVAASAHGTRIDVSIDEVAECRGVDVLGPMVQDVEIRRTFADDAQERNGVFAMLAGAGIGMLEYGVHQVDCSGGGRGCPELPAETRAGLYSLLGLAAIPVGFLAYNAFVAQDRRVIDDAAPEMKAGPWTPCPTQPLASEEITVVLGERIVRTVTGPDGHATVDLSGPPGAPESAQPGQAIVHHPGSADVIVDLDPASAGPPASKGPP